jgi:RNA recognition motif-containing protein
MKKRYVGNLAYSTNEESLRAVFEEIGQVESVAVITDRDTGRSRGFAFVEMPDEDAEKAMKELDGKSVDGRNLRVNEARERERRPPRRDEPRW